MSKTNSKSLTYALAATGPSGTHVSPINRIESNTTNLFTAARDGVIAVFDSDLQHKNHILLHTDWVNDITLLNNNLLASCSSDLSVKWWNYENGNHGLVGHHNDYVKALDSVNNKLIISGGLDKFVNVWDVATSTKISSYRNDLGTEKGSIYSLTSNNNGLSVFGDNDSNIVLFDINSAKPIEVLQGHNNTVKSLVIKDQLLLSGSSDKTINLWDLRTHSILQKWSFESSIWSIHSSGNEFKTFYAGGSDGSIYRVKESAKLINKQESGILSINEFNNEILSSSMSNSDLTNLTVPSKTIKGDHGLIKSRLLNNRRHVVTLSTNSHVILWDIIKCEKIKEYGSDVDFEDVIQDCQTIEILPTWCRVCIKSGKLFVTLSETNYSNVEIYGDDMDAYGLDLDPEIRYNLGKIMIHSIFKSFIEYEIQKDNQIRESKNKELSLKKTTTNENKLERRRSLSIFGTKKNNSKNTSAATTTISEQPTSTESSRKSSNSELINDTVQVLLQEISAAYDANSISLITPPPIKDVPLIKLPSDLFIIITERAINSSGEVDIYGDELNQLDFESLEAFLPKWIGNLILKNESIYKDIPKVGFIVKRHESETELPSLINGDARLNAYSMLRIKKILYYIIAGFDGEINHDTNEVENWMEVLCNEKVLDNNMTLATLRSTIWKSSGDINITYRLKEEKTREDSLK
ncbi:hypothetical protein WICMUC_003631 [Wickerhamomyces mucosus]|uniref:Uncharacterized protein n=1 Tax=Wickerhamomyces mucosus TaxID=1378264 RepID=A0A9P8PL25_9ASCO|nr:hypothetical protein WICMUC_003631 [Wickerhamomyces mucosus]